MSKKVGTIKIDVHHEIEIRRRDKTEIVKKFDDLECPVVELKKGLDDLAAPRRS